MNSGTLYRRSAFTDNPKGGNPAGVWFGETLPSVDVMQRIAAEVGYSETAFVAPTSGKNRTIRYYSPEMEVPFCGHATIATEVLSALGWQSSDVDGSIPPARAYAGVWHLVLAINDPYRLAKLNYDFERLKALMLREGLTTLQLLWRESTNVFHSRNPFPVDGVVEDPATGAAAAALGGYL
jgi:predicted PhzF superfamily epimerase YddE/YHI9